MTVITRETQLFALCHLGFGSKSSITFRRPDRISDWVYRSLGELMGAGYLETIPKDELPIGAKGWKATDKMPMPRNEFEPFTDAEIEWLKKARTLND